MLDKNAWHALYGKRKDDFGVGDCAKYLEAVGSVANHLKWTARQIDTGLFQLGSNGRRFSAVHI